MTSRTTVVSIIIAARNEEKYIGRCVRSILNQSTSKDKYEVIVVNDASEDRTASALEIFGNDIKVIHNEKQLGLPASLNKGIRQARGQYIVRVDGDDYVNSDFISILTLYLNLNHYMDAVACDYTLVDESENLIERCNCLERPIACGIMFRIEHLINVGLYDENFLIHEDQDLRIRFMKKHIIHRVELPLYRYRKHNNNMTNDKSEAQKFHQKLKTKHGINDD